MPVPTKAETKPRVPVATTVKILKTEALKAGATPAQALEAAAAAATQAETSDQPSRED